MSEQEFNKIFSKNLLFYLETQEKSQAELAKYVGVSTAAVNQWCKGLKTPRMDKVDKICKFLLIKRSDLIEEHPLSKEQVLLDRTSQYAINLLYKYPTYGALIEKANHCTPEELDQLKHLVTIYANLNVSGKEKLLERAEELNELGYNLKGDMTTTA